MDSLADFLEPHKEAISNAASLFTFVHFLSGTILCNDIRKKKSTHGQSAMPFLAGLILTTLLVRFGTILNDLATVRVNTIGVALHIAYVCYFYNYTTGVKEKTQVWAQTGYSGAFLAAVIAYTFVEDPKVLPFRYGILVTAVLFYLVGSPLLGLGEIIRKKSTEGLPFPIICTGTIISFLWFLHGIVHHETFTIVQNGVVFVMSFIQLVLFAIYPSTSTKLKKNSGAKKAVNSKKIN